jgi:hypothetical protein
MVIVSRVVVRIVRRDSHRGYLSRTGDPAACTHGAPQVRQCLTRQNIGVTQPSLQPTAAATVLPPEPRAAQFRLPMQLSLQAPSCRVSPFMNPDPLEPDRNC